MKAAFTIARRDLGSLFNSPIFYVLTTVFLILYNYIFVNILSFFSFQSVQASQFGGMSQSLNEMVVEPSLNNMSVILLLMIPIITMRSFAEEKKNRSFNLLLSSPLRLPEIVLGKFMACFGVVCVMILLTGYSIAFLFFIGEPETGPIISGYAGLILMAGCYVAVGVFASTLTDNQIVAAVICFGFTLFMWIIGWGAQAAGAGFGEVLKFLSLIDHLEHFYKGILDSSDVIYYLSFISLNLFTAHRVLDSQRWR